MLDQGDKVVLGEAVFVVEIADAVVPGVDAIQMIVYF